MSDLHRADLAEGGKVQIARVAELINDVRSEIPPEIDWILRVDGHTDKVPVGANSAFRSNWELSTARAISAT